MRENDALLANGQLGRVLERLAADADPPESMDSSQVMAWHTVDFPQPDSPRADIPPWQLSSDKILDAVELALHMRRRVGEQ